MLTGLSSNDEKPKGPPSKGQTESSRDAQGLKKLGLFGIIIGDLIGCTGAGIGLGYVAIAKWNAPWWVLVLSASAGLFIAFYQVFRISQKEQ